MQDAGSEEAWKLGFSKQDEHLPGHSLLLQMYGVTERALTLAAGLVATSCTADVWCDIIGGMAWYAMGGDLPAVATAFPWSHEECQRMATVVHRRLLLARITLQCAEHCKASAPHFESMAATVVFLHGSSTTMPWVSDHLINRVGPMSSQRASVSFPSATSCLCADDIIALQEQLFTSLEGIMAVLARKLTITIAVPSVVLHHLRHPQQRGSKAPQVGWQLWFFLCFAHICRRSALVS